MDDEPFDLPTTRHLDEFDDLSGGPGSAEIMTPRLDTGSNKGNNFQADMHNEARVARGARAMQGLFDESVEPYKYNYGGTNDLPLRSDSGSDSLHRKELSVSSAASGDPPNIDLNKVPKGRLNRATMQWKWDENLGDKDGAASTLSPPPVPEAVGYTIGAPSFSEVNRPKLTHSVTDSAIGNDRPMSETLDLDAMLGDASFTLNRTNNSNMYATGTTSGVTSTASTLVRGSESSPESAGDVGGSVGRPVSGGFGSNGLGGGPGDAEEDDGMIDLDIGDTMKPGYYAMTSTTVGGNSMHSTGSGLHSKKGSASSLLSRPTPSSTSPTFGVAGQLPLRSATFGGSAMSSFGASSSLSLAQRSLSRQDGGSGPPLSAFPWPQPINPAALLDNAPLEMMQEALESGLGNWLEGLEALMKKLDVYDDDGDDDGDDDDDLARPESRLDDGDGERKGSAGSMGSFDGPGDDVGEHLPGMDGDEGHDADGEGDGSFREVGF